MERLEQKGKNVLRCWCIEASIYKHSLCILQQDDQSTPHHGNL